MAQKDPLVEYTAEGHKMFEALNAAIREEVVLTLFHAELTVEQVGELEQPQEAPSANGGLTYEHESLAGAEAIAAAGGGEAVATVVPRQQQKVASEHEKLGRNEPCWCGSGKKYKRCHGQ
jgi:preprotein translocase subunit SecA